MRTEIFIITGASGTGKSVSVLLIKKELSSSYLVYDYDEILRLYDNSDTWADEVTEKMLLITSENKKKNIITVFFGLIRPYLVKKYANKYQINKIKLCLLDISTEERARRLKQRGSSMSLIGDIEEHEGFRTWIDEAGYESVKIDVTDLTPEEVIKNIKGWIVKNS
ncbi:hypothetical protein C4577_06255 [Candidatus Parcubacteria bacterium]|nr:MAG: hypothetical protein C4577_06255 [Candidatus Parcubacteria bacterium]